MDSTNKIKLAIIGGGAMGGAVARGIVRANAIVPENISVSNPHTQKLVDLAEQGVKVYKSNIEAIKEADLIVVAVKPWIVDEVIKEIRPYVNTAKTELTFIVAGISGDELYHKFNDKAPDNLSITMPNTAMSVGESMTFVIPIKGSFQLTKLIFSYLGKVLDITERQLPGAMALASCGIAFVMRYVRAACEGGVEMGIRTSEGLAIMTQTLIGAAKLLEQPNTHPEQEIDKVTTPGGYTIRGLNTMEKYGFSTSIIEGLKATRP